MEVEVKIIGRKDVAQNERRSIVVETHQKRGDIYNVAKTDTVSENDTAMFRLPPGGRLVIVTPEGDDEVVYDPAQAAAVRKSAQHNHEDKADAVVSRPIGAAHTPPQVNRPTVEKPPAMGSAPSGNEGKK